MINIKNMLLLAKPLYTRNNLNITNLYALHYVIYKKFLNFLLSFMIFGIEHSV